MEITEPVVLQIQQGRKTVRLELASRADGRDLIAAIASAMLRLPDDGEGHVDSHGEHAEMGNHDLNDALDRLSPSGIEQAVHYAHGYCAAGIEQAIRHQLEQDARPPREPEPASPEAAERLYDAIVAGTPVLVTDDEPEPSPVVRVPGPHPDESAFRHGFAPDETAPRPVLEVVHDTRSDSDVIPALQVPCPEAHPTNGTLCTGKIPHPMPHVDPDGDTCVTEPLAVSS